MTHKTNNKTKTENVYEQLEDMIIFCKIEPGSIFTENEITELIKAGRTPVREALRELAKEYLVVLSRVGVLIPDLSATTQLRVLEVRHSTLSLCVKCTIKRCTELDKQNIQQLLSRIDNQNNIEFLYWLKERHKVLAQASKNSFIYEQLKSVQGLSHRYWYYYAKEEDHIQGKKLHKEILQAILELDTDKALKCVDNLIVYLESFIKRNL